MAGSCTQPPTPLQASTGPAITIRPPPCSATHFSSSSTCAGAERLPVRVEGHDAVVVEHFLAGGGEIVEDLLGLLRHARLARLQQHVDRGVAIAEELIAEELVFPHRPVGQQQDVVLAVDDFDVGLAGVVGRVAVARRGPGRGNTRCGGRGRRASARTSPAALRRRRRG